MYNLNQEEERKMILGAYRKLLRTAKLSRSTKDRAIIRKAFDIAVEAHKTDRRKSGEPYILHPIEVAQIVSEEIGLGTTSVVCALLHDTVEDTYITLEDIENIFGKKVRSIIDGLTKIKDIKFDPETSSDQLENFKKLLLTLSDDPQVILIKIADRLHNMRTLGSMRKNKQLKIASETQFMFAPLAHRLGLYSIKSELEDLALKYKEPEFYEDITNKLSKTKAVRTRFVNKFARPIANELEAKGYKFTVKSRTKSIFSIWNKIVNKKVSFEEIYDLFAIRIILDCPVAEEKAQCWHVYSVVTDFYQPNTERLRDWISRPKSNGYESLHTTVMSPTGKWVEVQIRTERMDETAEKGYAAHWKYKDNNSDNSSENSGADVDLNLDQWLEQLSHILDETDASTLDLIDDIKLSLYKDEIFVFTPKGDLKTLPQGGTALDFAFEIHTQVGSSTIGVKVNNKLVPLSHVLNSGDQVEVMTSKNQTPKKDWLNFVVTGKAKSRIKSALKEQEKQIAAEGKEILSRKLNALKVDFLSVNISALEDYYKVPSALELYFRIAEKKIDLKKMKEYTVHGGRINFTKKVIVPPPSKKAKPTLKIPPKNEVIVLDNGNASGLEYKMAPCCTPIPGDDVFGFVTISDGVKIHRLNCPNATQLMSHYAYRVIQAQWSNQEFREHLAAIHFTGVDNLGLVNTITSTISHEKNLNMKSLTFNSNDGVFDGQITILVNDAHQLSTVITHLKELEGVLTVERVNLEQNQ